MKKFVVLLISFVFASSASAAIYTWVDEKGVTNFVDDYSKIPSAYRNKAEKVSIPKTGPLTPSQTPPGKIISSVQSGETVTQAPPIAQSLIREGDFAMKLAEVLKIGSPKGEAEAESVLATPGIMPKNGWIADYPVTPGIIGELQNAVGSAVDSGKLKMSRDEANKMVQDLAAQQGLPVQVDEGQNPVEQQPPDYGDSEVVNNYYYDEGPPVVTYFLPPWDYYYLYAWVPCPFWYTGFWFPGFFVLNDFHRHFGHHHFISNHFVDPKTHTSLRIDPRTRATGGAGRTVAETGSRGFSSPEARRGASSIFNRSADGKASGQSINAGGQYRGFQRSSTGSRRSFSDRDYNGPSSRSFSAASRGGRTSYGSLHGGGSGDSHGGHGGGGHGGGDGGGHR